MYMDCVQKFAKVDWLFYHVKQDTKWFKITKLYLSLAFSWDTSKSLVQCFVGRTFANLAV